MRNVLFNEAIIIAVVSIALTAIISYFVAKKQTEHLIKEFKK
jgi:uncharacterized protein YneF (UPF0154 family)